MHPINTPLPRLMGDSLFSAIIVTFNSANEVSQLLSDLRQLSTFPKARLIIVDNASTDNTVRIVRSQFPEATLVENKQNLGFSTAVNQGFALCHTEYVFLLNPDIRLYGSHFFPLMLGCIQECPSIAAVGPLQFKQNGIKRTLHFTWSHWSLKGLTLYFSYLFHLGQRYVNPIPTRFLNAGCVLIRKSAFIKVGKLNESYFLYGEEPDLFMKFIRFGYECRLHPGVEIVHYRERSLRTLSLSKRTLLRLKGTANIIDASIRGVSAILSQKYSAG